MTADIVDALLWRARAALRIDGLPLFAGHGLADPLYRPPRLPYASVLGPLSYTVEPDREPPREASLTVRLPGYLAGTRLADDATVPAPGELRLLFDSSTHVPVPVDHAPDTGQALTDERGRALAERIGTALHTAVDGGAATVAGEPVTDPARLDELRAATVRWDRGNRRVVIASGRRGPVGSEEAARQRRSAVALATPTPHAVALGLGEGASTPEGRLVRHHVPAPLAMAFDVRVDLWAGTQRHLAALVETWARVTPTRCQLLLRPALLAADVPDGSATVPLQAGGETPTRWTRLQLEPQGGFADRRTGHAVRRRNGATTSPGGLVLPAGAEATLSFLEEPAVPDPLAPAHPAPAGWAVSARVRVEPGAAVDDELVVAELRHGATTALRLTLTWVAGPGGPGGADVEVEARATGTSAAGDALSPAALRLPTADVASGVELHALVDATAGRTAVFAEGAVALAEPGGPVPPAGGTGMLLQLGPGTGPTAHLGHVQVHARPLGPLDHRHRSATADAGRWRPGDPVTLVRTEDGATPRGPSFPAVVVGVGEGELRLDRPVRGTWPRHDTVVATRVVFSQQTAVRRRDDLASNLTRISLEHTVSGFVEPEHSAVGARLVEALDLQVDARVPGADEAGHPVRHRSGAPAVQPRLVPARDLRSTVPTPGRDDAAGTTPPV